MKKSRPSIVAIVIIAVVFLSSFLDFNRYNDAMFVNYDANYYYSYLPALFIHHDLTLKFIDTDQKYGVHFWPEIAPNGAYVTKTTCGLSILMLPFFLIGHLFAYLFNYEMSGFTKPYGVALYLGTIIYSLLGLIVMRKVLMKKFSDNATAFALLGIGIGSNLYFYTVQDALVSHAYLFFLVAVFLFALIRWHEKPSLVSSLAIGLCGGLVVLIRPVDVLIIIPFIFYGVYNYKSLLAKLHFYMREWKYIILTIAVAFLVFIPQMSLWKFLVDQWIYYSYTDETFYFTNPHILEGLFSYRKGWLLYTPIMSLSIIGIFFLRKKAREFVIGIPLMLIVTIFILFSWWCWWYGGSFGARVMIEYYPFLAIPIAAVYEKMMQSAFIGKIVAPVIAFFFVYLNIFQTMQQRNFYIHWDSMTEKTYWHTFLRNNYYDPYDLKVPNYSNAKKGIDEY